MKALLALLGMALLLVTSGFAQSTITPSNELQQLQKVADDYLQKYHNIEYISGVTLMASDSSQLNIVYSGHTDMSESQLLNSKNLYQIGSITKSFVAAIILQLEATPSLHFSIDDKLSAYLP